MLDIDFSFTPRLTVVPHKLPEFVHDDFLLALRLQVHISQSLPDLSQHLFLLSLHRHSHTCRL